jgi:phenylacetate-CoA ligase
MPGALFNPEMEAISPEDQAAMERALLARQISYVARASDLYRKKFAEAGVTTEGIRSRDDLARLPFTTKKELRASQERRPPFGDFCAAPDEKIRRVHRTSGTTGRFVYTALTDADLALTHDCGARAFWAAGLRPRHRVVHCLNYCLWMGGYTDHANLENTGATVFPYGVGNSAQLVKVIQEAGIDAISCTPSYLSRLEEVVDEELAVAPAELGLRLGLFGGEPGLENPAFRKRLETTWQMRAQNANYGVSDVLCNFAAQCEENPALHFLGQGALLVELIDPESGQSVPIEAGAAGEMVLTHLKKEAQPLIRYRTADVIRILESGPCRCGRTGFRFQVAGRADDMLHVKGINVFPAGVAMVLEDLVPEVTGEFQIVVTHPSPYTHLDIRVEHGADLEPGAAGALQERVERAIRKTLNFKAVVELAAPGSIARGRTGKAVRVKREYRCDPAGMK